MTIGLCLCTYNRLSYLKQCIKALNKNKWGGVTTKVVIDDCSTEKGYPEYLHKLRKHGIIVCEKHINKGIGDSKNFGLQSLLSDDCDHLFLMEDDILMKHPNTCQMYIDYAKGKGIHHMNFALHGDMNKDEGFMYKDIYCYPNCVGAFSYYTRECIDKVGYFDENFTNAWEHVEHTYRISEAGMTTPFWKFADHLLNSMLLKEIPNSINHSIIRPRTDWQENIEEGMKYWIKKHGKFLPKREES